MTKKKHQGLVSLPRVVAVVALTLVAALTVDFGRKALDNYHIQRQVEWLRDQVAIEEQTNESLQARLEFVSSDAYVEQIARERLRLVKPGEATIVVVQQGGETSSSPRYSPVQEVTEQETLPYWRQWADLLLGSDQ